MFRRWVLPVLLILAAGVLGAWLVARRAGDPLDPLTGDGGRNTGDAPAPRDPPKPDPEPHILVLFGGQLEGRFWVPPCSKFRQGGFSRIGPVLRELMDKAPQTLLLDLGDVAGGPRGLAEAELFGGLSAYNDLGFAAVAVGEKDLGAGLARWQAIRSQAAPGVAVICANLRDDEGKPLVPGTTPIMVAGRRRVLVAATLSPTFEKELRDAGIPVRILDPVPALREALKAAGKADRVILLSHADTDETRRILREVPEVDVALAAHAGPLPWKEPEYVDGRALYAGGAAWQFVGGLVLEDQGEGRRPRVGGTFSRAVRVGSDPEIGIQVRADIALRRMREPGFVETSLREAAEARPVTEPLYTGPAACASCHPAAHAKWQEDPHSRSMKTVRERQFDVSWNCLSCHATAPGRRGGHATPGDAQAAVTCEACHGPGAAHVAADGRAPLEAAKTRCVLCHVPEMSPSFSFEEAWPRVQHGR